MKGVLQFSCVILLNGAFLYPLLFSGIGRPVSWLLVAAMAGGGILSFYLLIRYRKELR